MSERCNSDNGLKVERRHGNEQSVRLEWSDDEGEEVGTAAYNKFKAKRANARKKAVAVSKSKHNISTSTGGRNILGTTGVNVRKTRISNREREREDSISSSDDGIEWQVPSYVQERRATIDRRMRALQQGGLHLPPRHDEVDFSEDESEHLRYLTERPEFHHTQPVGPYQDFHLQHSAGIVPASISQYLRDYQKEGVSFLHNLYVYQRGGILGDDMGLGKTVQVITFLTVAFGKTGDQRDQKRMRKMRRAGKQYPKALIICPGSLMANWQDELERWGWWSVEKYHGSEGERASALEIARAGMLEIMITTYTTYRLHKCKINTIAWDCVIADECHVIKDRKSEISRALLEVNALCRIGLTGTAIQNKYEELWNLLNWTNPGALGPVTVWRARVCEPLKLGQSHNATNYELARARTTAEKLTRNLLPQFFLRRLKTLISDQLPKKSDRIVFCPLTETQTAAYLNFLESDIVSLIKHSSEVCLCGTEKKQGWCCKMFLDDGSPWQAWTFPAIQTLQKLANHVALLIPQPTDLGEKQNKDLDYLQLAVPEGWKQLYANRDNLTTYSNPEFCGKWKILRKLLKFWYEQGNNKVLIFSHSVRLLKMLKALCDMTSYNMTFLDGSMKYDERYTAVQDFNSDPTQFIFLISTRAGGVGLNITSANKVVVIDPNWNPSYDLQAQDRAYRIGQTRDVEVFRLISQGTIEEIVYARQIYKQQQANIGYTNSTERRYFQGVQGNKEQKGEIFGLQNLFSYQDDNIVLRNIVNKTNVAESRAGIRVANLTAEAVPDNNAGDNGDDARDEFEDTDTSSRPAHEKENAVMSQIAAEIMCEPGKHGGSSKKPIFGTATSISTSFKSNSSRSNKVNQRHDPVQAILSSVGVSYTHENSEVIGSSTVEAQLSKRAREAADRSKKNHETQDQQQKVFLDDSQSQHTQQDTMPSRAYDLKGVRYRYSPPEAVKKRQFGAMARAFGYGNDADGILEFASVVESWTQAQRRACLDQFYQFRRERLDAEARTPLPDRDAADGGVAERGPSQQHSLGEIDTEEDDEL